MKKLKAIMVDFDGVVVESVGIKNLAFKELFFDFPDQLDDIISYHLSHNAIVRFEKFRHIYEHILKKEYTDQIADDLSRRFSDIVVSGVTQCPFVEGAMEFLEHFYRKIPVYLISVTPKDELIKILKIRKISEYFKGVYPADWKKIDAMKDILKKEGLSSDQAIYIGDAPEDRLAAQAANIPFVGRSSGKIIGGNVDVCKDLREVKERLLAKLKGAGPESEFQTIKMSYQK